MICRVDKVQVPSGNLFERQCRMALALIRHYLRGTIAGWRVTRLSGLLRFSNMGFVGLIRRSRHPAFLQQHRFSLYIKSHSEGVVSPLKSANRSVNDKVWTPWMADRGEPRQGASPGTGEQVESSRPQSGTWEVSAVRSTDFLAGPRGLIRGARPLPLSRSPHR